MNPVHAGRASEKKRIRPQFYELRCAGLGLTVNALKCLGGTPIVPSTPGFMGAHPTQPHSEERWE